MSQAYNGRQLFGLRRLRAMARMGRHPRVKRLSLRQKLAVARAASQSKLTELDGQIYSNTFTPPYPSPAYDRFLQGLVATGTGHPVPVIVNFAVTARCICRCWHCSFSNRDPQDQLTTAELLAAIGGVQDLGAAVIGFTGGEPLLRGDLEQLMAAASERSTPLLFTTGHGLTAARVRALADAGLKMPVVSLDHHRPEVHDGGRGVDGMHATALASIRLFREAGLYTSVSFVPTRALLDDEQELDRCLDLFRELGVNDMRLTSPILSGKLTHRPDEALEPRHVERIFKLQKRCSSTDGYPGCFAYDYFESPRFYGCGAGYNYLFVDSLGNACPCDFTMMSVGNVRDRPVRELWDRMSSLFHTPGPTCYASRVAGDVAACEAESWPLSPEQTEQVLARCPSHTEQLPRFYRGMGFTRRA